jgi:hypothetical protein
LVFSHPPEKSRAANKSKKYFPLQDSSFEHPVIRRIGLKLGGIDVEGGVGKIYDVFLFLTK